MAKVLSPKDKGVPVFATRALAGGVVFATTTHNVTTEADCYITAIEFYLPAGESITVTKLLASGNSVPVLTSQPSGTYYLGNRYPLKTGDALEFATVNDQAAAREYQITAERG